MASRKKISFIDQPGLFDEMEYSPEEASPASAPVPGDVSDMAAREEVDRMRFFSIGSGSSGNCAYVGDSRGGFLIDAGVDRRQVEAALKSNAIDWQKVWAVVLTHDHSDHVHHVYSLVKQYRHLAVMCTPRTLEGIMRRSSLSRRLRDYHKAVYKEFEFTLGNFAITPFDVSHDGTDNVGYHIVHHPSGRTFTVATDLGEITERVDHYMRLADNIMIEANYDLPMLLAGKYPEYLKRRIMASNGHLDNAVTGAYLARIASSRLSNIFLCHLSADNNTPEKARGAIADALAKAGFEAVGDASGSIESRRKPLQLTTLPRFEVSPLFFL